MLETERIHALDNLRALAMFLGIVLHAGMTFGPAMPLPYHDVMAHPVYDLLFMFIHGFRMHLFFFLAGFFGSLLCHKLGPKAFALQRLKRIGLPFLIGLPLFVLPTLLLIVWGAAQFVGTSSQIPLHHPPDAKGFPPAHLWFLQFLLFIYAGAILLVAITQRIAANPLGGRALATLEGGFAQLIQSPIRLLIFVPFTVACVWNGPIWGEPEIPGISFVPKPRAVLHYSIFFAVGWGVHRVRQSWHSFTKFLPSTLFVAFICEVVHLAILRLSLLPGTLDSPVLKSVSIVCSAIYSWGMVFGITGLFLRFGNSENSRVRYLADASYWCYLAHLPLVVLLQILLARWEIPGPLKLGLIITCTVAFLLFLYEYRVRYTWVGNILNGRRSRPDPALPAVVTVQPSP